MRKGTGKGMGTAVSGTAEKATAAKAFERKRLAGQEILTAMNGLDEELLELLPLAEGKEGAVQKTGGRRWPRWAVAAVCSLCLIGGSVVLAASKLSWHIEEHVDPHRDEN